MLMPETHIPNLVMRKRQDNVIADEYLLIYLVRTSQVMEHEIEKLLQTTRNYSKLI